jgi:ribosomal protein L31E
MSKIIKVEALIASPPTSKCQETIRILEEVVRRHPDEVQLVVFKRGIDFVPDELRLEVTRGGEDFTPKQASLQMRIMIQKGSAVPSCVVDGVLFSSFEVPNLERLEIRVQEILRSTAMTDEAGS